MAEEFSLSEDDRKAIRNGIISHEVGIPDQDKHYALGEKNIGRVQFQIGTGNGYFRKMLKAYGFSPEEIAGVDSEAIPPALRDRLNAAVSARPEILENHETMQIADRTDLLGKFLASPGGARLAALMSGMPPGQRIATMALMGARLNQLGRPKSIADFLGTLGATSSFQDIRSYFDGLARNNRSWKPGDTAKVIDQTLGAHGFDEANRKDPSAGFGATPPAKRPGGASLAPGPAPWFDPPVETARGSYVDPTGALKSLGVTDPTPYEGRLKMPGLGQDLETGRVYSLPPWPSDNQQGAVLMPRRPLRGLLDDDEPPASLGRGLLSPA
jgi:hypothetical protein